MKTPCRIEISTTRFFSAVDLFSPFTAPEEEPFLPEAISDPEEEELFRALSEESDLPCDRGKETPTNHPLHPKAPTAKLVSDGVFWQEEDGSFRIVYEESEITGMQGCLTTFCLSPSGLLILLRSGNARTCMVFENARRHLCDYGTEKDFPSFFLHTHRLSSSLSENGGKILAEYSVEIRGTRSEHNLLEIMVLPKKSHK